MFRLGWNDLARLLVLLTCAAAGIFSALPCEAALVTHLGIYNNTQLSFSTKVVVVDNQDWAGENRPDRNFNRQVAPLAGSVQQEDLNSKASSARYRMTITFQNSDAVFFTANQYIAQNHAEYIAEKLPLSGPQAFRYSASQVTVPGKKVVISITRRKDPANWMAALPDNLLITQLTIPGTHDSGALYGGLFSQTQDIHLKHQLDVGVRYFDIRLDENLKVFHGPFYQNLNFSDVMNICGIFLDRHPGEAILVSVDASDIKRNKSNPDPFAFAVYDAINSSSAPWMLAQRIPRVGQVRGKMLLLRRYPAGSAPKIGIDVSDWPEDTRYFTHTNSSGVTFAIQDHWKCCASSDGKTDKRNEIRAQIDRARASANSAPATLYFNFTSANNPPLISPIGNAFYFNPYLLALFAQTPSRLRNGVLAMDFIEWEQPERPDSNDPEALLQQILSYNANRRMSDDQ